MDRIRHRRIRPAEFTRIILFCSFSCPTECSDRSPRFGGGSCRQSTRQGFSRWLRYINASVRSSAPSDPTPALQSGIADAASTGLGILAIPAMRRSRADPGPGARSRRHGRGRAETTGGSVAKPRDAVLRPGMLPLLFAVLLPPGSITTAQALAPGDWDIKSTVVTLAVPGLPGFIQRMAKGRTKAERKRLVAEQGIEALLAPDPKATCRIDSQHVAQGRYNQVPTCPQKKGQPMQVSPRRHLRCLWLHRPGDRVGKRAKRTDQHRAGSARRSRSQLIETRRWVSRG